MTFSLFYFFKWLLISNANTAAPERNSLNQDGTPVSGLSKKSERSKRKDWTGVNAIPQDCLFFFLHHFFRVRFLHQSKKTDLYASAVSTCRQWKELWCVCFDRNCWGIQYYLKWRSTNHEAENMWLIDWFWSSCGELVFVDFFALLRCSELPMSPSFRDTRYWSRSRSRPIRLMECFKMLTCVQIHLLHA